MRGLFFEQCQGGVAALRFHADEAQGLAYGHAKFANALLIVDDEQSIRKLCVTVGEALGFICMEAESGDSALALLEEQPAHMVTQSLRMLCSSSTINSRIRRSSLLAALF